MGRHLAFSEGIADEVCDRLAEGETLRAICKDSHLPKQSTVARWAERVPSFGARLARARILFADTLVDQTADLVDQALTERDKEFTNAVKLKTSFNQWLVGCANPDKYGPRLNVEQTVSISITDALNLADKRFPLPVVEGETVPQIPHDDDLFD